MIRNETFALCGRMLLAVLLAAFAVGCSEDETPAPSYRQDLAELITDADGYAVRLVPDVGEPLTVINTAAVGQLRPDTAYRVLTLYTAEAGQATLQGLTPIVSPLPSAFGGNPVPNAPVRVDAVWRGGRYANLLVTVATSNKGHKFAFADRGVAQFPDGHLLQAVELYHDRNGDGEYYERQVYLSCPLYGFGQLQAGRDSVELRINTYEGLQTRRLPF